MVRPSGSTRRLGLILMGLLVFGVAEGARAASAETGARGDETQPGRALATAEDTAEDEGSAPTSGQPRPVPDFLFGRPKGSLRIRGSWLFARERSDLFSFLRRQLTIDAGDFNAPALGVEFGTAVAPRAEILFGIDFSRASMSSEYRDFVDTNDAPISQKTSMSQLNLGGSVKVALTPRGRSAGQLAWIPSVVTPYAGGGAGLLWYRFEQRGDFVDFVDLSIFESRFRSSGWTPSVHLFAGADLKLARRLFLGLEARYLWADADLDSDFAGFEPIDLTGLKAAAGLTVLF